MGLSYFDVLAKIWFVGPNMMKKVIAFLMQINKEYALVRISLIVVELN